MCPTNLRLFDPSVLCVSSFLCGRHRFVNQKQEPIDRTCMWREQIILTSLIFTWEMYMTNHSYPLMDAQVHSPTAFMHHLECLAVVVPSLPLLVSCLFYRPLPSSQHYHSTNTVPARVERLGGTACNMHVYTNSLSLSQPYR